MTLPPELTARIERVADTSLSHIPPGPFRKLELERRIRLLATFSEPLHKEIEELKGKLAEAERQIIHRDKELMRRTDNAYVDWLKAQLAEAKDQITSLQYELAAANHQP